MEHKKKKRKKREHEERRRKRNTRWERKVKKFERRRGRGRSGGSGEEGGGKREWEWEHFSIETTFPSSLAVKTHSHARTPLPSDCNLKSEKERLGFGLNLPPEPFPPAFSDSFGTYNSFPKARNDISLVLMSFLHIHGVEALSDYPSTFPQNLFSCILRRSFGLPQLISKGLKRHQFGSMNISWHSWCKNLVNLSLNLPREA